MGKINLLDTEVSNKIAAGEVVERPCSVIKELVENSIDAGATKISVEIKNGGTTYIKVSDNGSGMERDDASVAFLRHATSKIKEEKDLDAIYTLGFRGEALSSIGAVAMVDLFTKRKEDKTGTHTVCEGGEIVSDEDAGIPDGTTFIVKNIFYNVPARMKFLKKDATEAGYIADIMTRFILSHPKISFKLINNGKVVLNSYGDGKLENSVYAVYGRDYATSMITVDFESEYVRIKGLCGKGTTARPNRNYQSFFINGRYIKSPVIMKAVEEAYKNQIMIGKFPTAILNIEINPSLIDINVHPTKLEVKFSNEAQIYQGVYHAVQEALYRVSDIPEIVKKEEKKKEQKEELKKNFTPDKKIGDSQLEINTAVKFIEEKPIAKEVNPFAASKTVKEELKKTEDMKKPEEKPFAMPERKQMFAAAPKMFSDNIKKLDEIIKENKKEKPKEPVINTEQKEIINETKDEIKEETQKVSSPPVKDTEFKLIGQVFDTYIIIERNDRMELIDQHAAHERLKYEELRKSMEERQVFSQGLLIPETVQLSGVEMAVFMQNTEFLSSLGFEAEEFGSNTVIIRSVPINTISENISGFFIEILSQLAEHKKEIITEKKQRLLYTIACKAAIKANKKLDEREQKELVKMVLELENINTCPHGRPIIVSMTKKEIEKSFKRII